METLHYLAGHKAAETGKFRAMPSNIPILSQAWRDWYAGYDCATENGKNTTMTKNFSLRKKEVGYTYSF